MSSQFNVRVAVAVAGVCAITAMTAAHQRKDTMPSAKILVHITHGPEQPTRAALGFLVARTAIEQGQTVTLFLAGDAVQLMRDGVLDSLAGLGTGKLREHYDAIVKGGGRFYLSGMSSNARGLSAADLAGKPAEMAQPSTLINLSLEHDRMFTY